MTVYSDGSLHPHQMLVSITIYNTWHHNRYLFHTCRHSLHYTRTHFRHQIKKNVHYALCSPYFYSHHQ